MNNEENENHNSNFNTQIDSIDELSELILIREQMENDIRKLWDDVIVPQLNNVADNYILGRLTVNDYHKFYEYMISNNENFYYVCRRAYFLENQFN